MASILFDDITFPRELYDPDTFEFVAPVSTLLAFTPHILSQLAKTSESEQEPMPIPATSSSKGKRTKDDNNTDNNTNQSSSTENNSSTSGEGTEKNSSGVFSSVFQNFTTKNGLSILENGLYLAGRYKDASSSSSRDRYSNANANGRTSFSSWEREDAAQDSRNRNQDRNSSWFGTNSRNQHDYSYNNRERERDRLKEMEKRLQQMEKDMHHNTAMARSEIESQRRERINLEQQLDAQKLKVKKLEAEMENQRVQEADRVKKQKQKEKEEAEAKERERKMKLQEKSASAMSTKSSKNQKEEDEEEDEKEKEKKSLLKKESEIAGIATGTILAATVGVASLAVSLYSAHKASATYSVVTFHDQLEELINQCEGVIQSTEAWISEQFLEVPEQIPEDLRMIKELIDTIPVAWSMSAVGSLGAVGGAVIGSMTAMASGGTLVVGCALYGIVARARYNGPEYKGARTMLELKTAQILRSLGVNPSAPSTTSGGNARMSLIHDSRIERLRNEFEKRDGHDIRDADEIDGLVVEEAIQLESFSAPFVSQRNGYNNSNSSKKNNKAPVLSDSSYRLEEIEDFRPTLRLKSEPSKSFAY
ncbi:hypothetical protein BGZ49_000250 [Haplosporangium sp. Z 27]|nr:hypothetical protein BGZ49_000250 [Haplosporangium sp. Z 27]